MKTANTVWAERMNHPVSGETGLRADVERAVDGMYPLHMPGHKRRVAPAEGLPYAWDVTEVPGTDDLHDALRLYRRAGFETASAKPNTTWRENVMEMEMTMKL